MRALRWLVAAAAVAAAPGGLAAQAAPAPATPPPALRARTAAEDLQLFSQVFNQIRVNHPDSLDTHRLFLAAIRAMVQATDPHSYVIPAARLSAGKEAEFRDGKLHPLPITFNVIGGTPIVAQVAPGTAAKRQDILIGDELVNSDGVPVRADSPLELEVQLAGPRGSFVTLDFDRRRPDGSYARITRRVKRERFSEDGSVPSSVMLDSATGYIRITSFGDQRVAEDLRAAVGKLEGAGMKRLILDLRGNGGGLVDEAASVAGAFLPVGTLVYTSEGRRAEAVDTGKVTRSFFGSSRTLNHPLVVMIDDGTASASELVAGALQDHDRATIVGQASFGKSLMMRGFPLSDGSVIVLVVGQVRTPCGRAVQRAYRDITSREYYRGALAERDTVGRPSCKTKGGRTLYGGGGIYPDVRLPRQALPPSWVGRSRELDLPVKWGNAFLGDSANKLGTFESFTSAPRIPDAAVAQFRALARENEIVVPEDPESDRRLRALLAQVLAYARWGDRGAYTLEAHSDTDIREAMKHFTVPARP